ncbi:MAG: tetratricopeptide repeat protein [Deltaproteobacteria bacterium]|nr:tetratricopeptide repeat protein [Deltaproteobacteria bacterium]
MSAPIAPPSGRFELSVRNLLILAVPVIAAGLRWGYGVSGVVVTALLAPIIVFSFGLPRILRWRARRFERQLLRLMQLRRKGELIGLYRRQVLLRLFAAPSYLAARRAMVHQELGSHAEARDAFRSALERTVENEKLPLLIGLANACYELGEDADAEPIYREVLSRGARLPNVFHNLAHGLIRRDVKLDDAIELLEEGISLGGGSHLHLALAEAHAALRENAKARAALARVSIDPSIAERFATVAGEVGYDPGAEPQV